MHNEDLAAFLLVLVCIRYGEGRGRYAYVDLCEQGSLDQLLWTFRTLDIFLNKVPNQG